MYTRRGGRRVAVKNTYNESLLSTKLGHYSAVIKMKLECTEIDSKLLKISVGANNQNSSSTG